MLQTPAPTPIILFYPIEDFFDLASIESMYRTELDMDQAGMTKLDYRSLTNNDQKFFDLLLKRAASDCYTVLQPLTRRPTKDFYSDEPFVNKAAGEAFGFNAIPKRTIKQLLAKVLIVEGMVVEVLDAGSLNYGALDVIPGDKVYLSAEEGWIRDNSKTDKYIFYTLGLPWNYDLNNQFALDDKVKEFITIFVVREWFRRQKYDPSFIEPEFTNVRNELGKVLNYRTHIIRKSRTF